MKLVRFSENLKKILEQRGVKLISISKATGIPMSTLSEWTAGREPKVSDAIVKLCQFLDITLDELVLGENRVLNNKSVLAKTYVVINGIKYCIKFHSAEIINEEN
ncbi:MAG: helix-turn-helix transcriptional regulator [Bdellovibrionales bacterium]|nr:helix-turn-helix transcriptional regulator [Bdellovibrionales bacterium]